MQKYLLDWDLSPIMIVYKCKPLSLMMFFVLVSYSFSHEKCTII